MSKWRMQVLVGILAAFLVLSACRQQAAWGLPGSLPAPSAAEMELALSEPPEFSAADVEAYSGSPYVAVNGNVPYFSEDDMTDQSYESYGALDTLGRCQSACAVIGLDLMPTEKRGDISQVKPTGWQPAEYSMVEGGHLYNRCHLIGYQLSGENANERNLITGTAYMNVEGMLPFENMVADYVRETRLHVLYRVTPVFEGDNLIASGVLMEAKSVEDRGEGILFCVYAYNVQPGIAINYATGDSAVDPAGQGASAVSEAPPQAQGATYILNRNTKKFHVPDCDSVRQMKDSNKREFMGSRDDAIAQGYSPCGECKP